MFFRGTARRNSFASYGAVGLPAHVPSGLQVPDTTELDRVAGLPAESADLVAHHGHRNDADHWAGPLTAAREDLWNRPHFYRSRSHEQ